MIVISNKIISLTHHFFQVISSIMRYFHTNLSKKKDFDFLAEVFKNDLDSKGKKRL